MKAKVLAGLSFYGGTAGIAHAQVCAQMRPDWVSLDGAMTPLGEVAYFSASPLGLALIVLLILHLWVANRLTLYLVLVAAVFSSLGETELFWAPSHIQALSYSEGCRGLPWLTLPVIGACAVIAIIRSYRRPRS
jgi:hypothetical protein